MHRYDLEPEEIRLAVRWLELNDPDYAVSLPEVLTRAQKTVQVALENREPALPQGNPAFVQSGKHYNSDNCNVCPTEQQGNSAAYRIRKLRRDHPDIAERLEAGEFPSVAAAERVARGEPASLPRKQLTALEQLRRWWERASEEERSAFLEEIS